MQIHTLSIRLVDWLLLQNEDKKKYREFYDYSMEIILSTVANFLISIGLALVLGIESNVFWYILFFLPYRFLFGGIHAKTHARCIATFAVSMLVNIYVARKIPVTRSMLVIEWIAVLVAHVINYHDGKQASIVKSVACFVLSILVLLWLNLVSGGYTNGICATFALLTQTVLLRIKIRGEGK